MSANYSITYLAETTPLRSRLLMQKPLHNGWDTAVSEETIFGIASRHHRLSGNILYRESNFELTGNRDVLLSAWFPSNLPDIFSRLRLPVTSIDDLINRHTVLPYFRLFTSSEGYAKTFENLKSGFVKNIKSSLGLIAGGFGAKNVLRFCPECGEQDCRMLGVETWYRVHQLPGVLVCPYHGIPLKVVVGSFKNYGTNDLFLPLAMQNTRDCVLIDNAQLHDRLLLIARLSAELLLEENLQTTPLFMKRHYLAGLRKKGLATVNCCNKQAVFRDSFSNFWSALSKVEPFSLLLSSCGRPKSWLSKICHKHTSTMHPLQHLLLIGFLSENIKSFLDVPGVFAAKKITRPKVTCSKEAKKAISNLHKGGRTAGQIATEIGLPTRVVRVIEARAGAPFKQKPWKFHPILRSQACAALAAGKLVSEIARSLHVSSSTIYLILNNDLDLKSQRAALIFEQRKTKARNNLLSAIKDLCPSTLSQLSAVSSGDFTWASRHDSKWLADQTKSVGLHPSCRPAVDWAMRDALFFDLISSIVEEVLRLSNPPVQLRKGEILRRIRHPLWSGFMLSRFPRTSLLLQQTVETDDSFRRRCQTSRSA